MEERQIITLIKQGKNECFNELLRSYSKLINHIITRNEIYYSIYPMLREDLFQEGTIALYQACLKYKEDADVKFSTFAYVVISRRIKKRISEHLKRSSLESYSIDSVEERDHLKDYADHHYNQDRISLLDKREKAFKFVNNLPDIDKKIVFLRQKDYSYDEIAKILKITKKQVDNKLYHLKLKYKTLMEN